MTEGCFQTRRRIREARAAISRNGGLKHSGADYDVLMGFINDLATALASRTTSDRNAEFYYVVRSMGVFVKRHAEDAYKPFGYANPFAAGRSVAAGTQTNAAATPPAGRSKTPDTPIWKYPVIHMPPAVGVGPFDADFRDLSALKMYGYTVGKTKGWRSAERRAFLMDFMEMDLPPAVSTHFGNEYGGPCTTERLRKVANVIAGNASNFYRNDAGRYAAAIRDWEEDLGFLRSRYYEGMGLKFMPWPSSRPQ